MPRGNVNMKYISVICVCIIGACTTENYTQYRDDDAELQNDCLSGSAGNTGVKAFDEKHDFENN